jgi:MFS family permease
MTIGSSSALRHRGFRAFFTAASISNAAVWMQLVAVPALLYDLTGKATWLGLSTMSTLIPALVLTPWAGVLADRHNRRIILLVTQTVQMCAGFALWGLYTSDRITPLAIIGVGFVTGVASGFQTSAWQSFIPSLVPLVDMLDAVRLNSVQFTIGRAVGPAMAGVVVTRFGVGTAIFINAGTYLLVIAVLLIVRPRANATLPSDLGTRQAMLEGARWVWHNRGVRLAAQLSFLAAFVSQSLQHVSAAIAALVFSRESTDNAGLLSALGVGALVASLASGTAARRFDRSRLVGVALVLFALSPLLIAATDIYVLGLAGYFVGGMGHLTLAVALNTLIQVEAPDEFRGRAMSFYLLGVLAGIPFGAFTIGALGDLIGMRPVLIANGLLVAVVAAWLIGSGRLAALVATRPTSNEIVPTMPSL